MLAEWRNTADGQAHLDASQRLYRSLGDTWGAARALEGLGFATLIGLEAVAAEDYYRQAITLLGTTGDPRIRARLRYRLALALAFQGRRDEAERYIQESMALARSLDDRSVVARVLAEQAAVGCFLGSFAEALGRGQESLALYQDLGDRYQLPNTCLILANILLHLGDWEGCRAHAEQAMAFLSWNEEQAICSLGTEPSRRRQRWPTAPMIWRCITVWRPSVWRAGPKSDTKTARAIARLVWQRCCSGDPDQARRYLMESLLCVQTGCNASGDALRAALRGVLPGPAAET